MQERATALLTAMLIDDEQLAQDELAYLLKEFPDIEIVGAARHGLEAVELIQKLEPDLVFMDVQMPGLDGLAVVRKLRELNVELPHIIFATAFDHYAVQAFDVNAVDYVLKPFDKARIAKAIQRARREIESETSPADRLEQLVSRLGAAQLAAGKPAASGAPSKILVNSQQRLMLVDAEDFIFASIEDGSISVFARDLEGTSNYRTLEEMEEALASDSFWRPHRSYLVNIHHIKEVVPWFKSSYMLKMDDKKHSEVPVSRQQTKRLRELFKL